MTTATKGADLDRRMYALGPTALADEAASLLWDDGRRSLYEGDAAGCDAAAAPGLTPLQREVLGAATLLRRLCDEGPEWRVAACEALAAAPAAVDTALALLAAPPRFGAGAPAGACAARHVRPGDAAAGAADAPPDALGAGAAAVLRRGPAGLLASVAAATHPVLATVAGSRWWPRAAAALARLARGEGHGDDALRDVAADALRLVLSVGPVRAAAPLAAADRDQVCGAGADLACARDRRCLACCRPATARVRVPARRLLSPRPRRLPAPRLAPAPGGLPRGGARAGRRPPGAGAPPPPRRDPSAAMKAYTTRPGAGDRPGLAARLQPLREDRRVRRRGAAARRAALRRPVHRVLPPVDVEAAVRARRARERRLPPLELGRRARIKLVCVT